MTLKTETTPEPLKEDEKIFACWAIELNCECPHCEKYVNLLDAADFWDGHRFDLAEHGTERTRKVEVVCPDCLEEFEVCLEY